MTGFFNCGPELLDPVLIHHGTESVLLIGHLHRIRIQVFLANICYAVIECYIKIGDAIN